jgi:hypothetical protein
MKSLDLAKIFLICVAFHSLHSMEAKRVYEIVNISPDQGLVMAGFNTCAHANMTTVFCMHQFSHSFCDKPFTQEDLAHLETIIFHTVDTQRRLQPMNFNTLFNDLKSKLNLKHNQELMNSILQKTTESLGDLHSVRCWDANSPSQCQQQGYTWTLFYILLSRQKGIVMVGEEHD